MFCVLWFVYLCSLLETSGYVLMNGVLKSRRGLAESIMFRRQTEIKTPVKVQRGSVRPYSCMRKEESKPDQFDLIGTHMNCFWILYASIFTNGQRRGCSTQILSQIRGCTWPPRQ